jgi:hypothetical protein
LASTNFKQWNPPANNMESDSAYAADSQRTGGAAVNSPFASALANKLFYQFSTFLTGFANAFVGKGLSLNDGSADPSTAVATIQSILGGILTTSDTINYTQLSNIPASQIVPFVSQVVASFDVNLYQNAIGATVLYTPAVDGIYRVSWYAIVAKPAPTGSTLGPFQLNYGDPSTGGSGSQINLLNALAQDGNGNWISSNSANATAAGLWGVPIVVNQKAGVELQFHMGYNSVGSAIFLMQYSLHIRVEYLGPTA